MTLRMNGVVKKGKLVLAMPVPLPDGAEVVIEVTVKDKKASAAAKRARKQNIDPLLWLAEHAVDTGITDMAEEHDHYIYGTPKRSKRPK